METLAERKTPYEKFNCKMLHVMLTIFVVDFGPADQAIKSTLFEWVDKKKEKPFFLSLLTAATHHPYKPPKTWDMYDFSPERFANRFMNLLRYDDDFLKDVFEEFRKRGLTKNTLFVISGDHGVSMKDHDDHFGTYKVMYEELFKIPIMFYTENQELQSKIKQKRPVNEVWTNMDILPTLVDIITPTAKVDRPMLFELLKKRGYYGKSIHAGNYTDEPIVAASNPGFENLGKKDYSR